MRYISGSWYYMLFLLEIMTYRGSNCPQHTFLLQSVALVLGTQGTEVHYGAPDFLSLCNS